MATVNGTNGNDPNLSGFASKDSIYGFKGNDTSTGKRARRPLRRLGINNLWGGAGYDTFSMSARNTAGYNTTTSATSSLTST